MSTRTTKCRSIRRVGLILLVGVLAGCGHPELEIESGAVAQLWQERSKQILDLLDPPSGTSIRAAAARMDDGLYIVFISQDNKLAVAFDIGCPKSEEPLSIRNLGFGEHLDDSSWRLIRDKGRGSDVELQGGLWTIDRMGAAIDSAVTNKPIKAYPVLTTGS